MDICNYRVASQLKNVSLADRQQNTMSCKVDVQWSLSYESYHKMLNIFFYNFGHSVRPYESVRSFCLSNFCNLSRLELTYRVQYFRDYSFCSQVLYEKQSNSIFNTGTFREFLTELLILWTLFSNIFVSPTRNPSLDHL